MKGLIMRHGGLVAALLVSTACASLAVRSYQVRGFEPRKYHTYAWATVDMQPTGDARLDNNRFFDERVRRAVDAELARSGFEPQTRADRADLLVHYHASMTEQIDVSHVDGDYSVAHREETSVTVFEAGTLLVDLVDAQTNVLVWRGWAEGSFEGVIDNQAALEKRIDDSIARIMRPLRPEVP